MLDVTANKYQKTGRKWGFQRFASQTHTNTLISTKSHCNLNLPHKDWTQWAKYFQRYEISDAKLCLFPWWNTSLTCRNWLVKSVNTVALLHYKNIALFFVCFFEQPERTSCTTLLKRDLFEWKMADGAECSGNLFGNETQVIIYANPFNSAKWHLLAHVMVDGKTWFDMVECVL